MFCVKCRRELKEEFDFCIFCGAPAKKRKAGVQI